LNIFIARELIILILVISISSSNIIKDGFPTIQNTSSGFSTTEEFSVEEGHTPKQDIGKTARSIKAANQSLSILDNNSYDALPFSKFLKYYINKTNEQIRYMNCLEVLQESKQPETIIKIPCETIFIFIINNDNFTKNYNVPNSLSIQPFNYKDGLTYQLKLLPKLITEVDSKNKFHCGKIQGTVSFKTEIISCTNIGILIR
jgi:hypothetical protein